jgi:transposase-like protein
MQRKKTPEEIRRSELLGELIKLEGLRTVEDAQNFVKEILGSTVQKMLVGELDEKLGYSKYDYRNKATANSRNGYSKKTVVSSAGDIELDIPRDRDGEFEPKLIGKNQTKLDDSIENRIISMYAKGMTVRDISDHINEAYGFDVSESMVSRITDKVLPLIRDWQARPLESVYAIVFLDAIHYPVRQDGRIVKKAVYVALGLDLDGRKDILGMWVGENESAKYWLNVLNELKNRGINDILIACTDNLSGFDEAIHAVYPKTDLQHCIIHQIRSSTKYVSYKDLKALMADLKKVYTALTEPEAYANLETFNGIWGKKYPKIFESWSRNWANLTTYFQYPQEVRKIIYTTNQIENLNRAFRKVTKSKAAFPSDESLMKMLYLAMMDITAKWTGKRMDWTPIRLQLNIYYSDRIPE